MSVATAGTCLRVSERKFSASVSLGHIFRYLRIAHSLLLCRQSDIGHAPLLPLNIPSSSSSSSPPPASRCGLDHGQEFEEADFELTQELIDARNELVR